MERLESSPMCIREGFTAAIWLGFASLALVTSITPFIF
jgi:hypothetical protein